MKKLSAETIRDMGDRLLHDLAGLIFGFQKFSKILTKEALEISSQKIAFSFEGVQKTDARTLVSEDGNEQALEKILIDADTGNAVKIVVDRDFIDLMSEFSFGGDGAERSTEESRPLSNIEKDIADYFIALAGRNMAASFENPDGSVFALEAPSEDGEEKAPIEFKSQLTVKLRCNLKSLIGYVYFDLPASIVLKFGTAAMAIVDDVSKVADKWKHQILTRLEPTELDLIAVLAEIPLSLDAMTNLSVGQTIALHTSFKTPVVVEAGDVNLYQTKLGQSKGKYCLVVQTQQNSI